MVLLLALAAGCSHASSVVGIEPDAAFERAPATGDELGRFERAAAYSAAHGGRALMVVRGHQVIFERGLNGHALSAPQHLFSGTKSFTCALFGVLAADGRLTRDESVAATLPELAVRPELTVDHLLTLTSGMRQDFRVLTFDGVRPRQREADKVAYALRLPFDHAPGEVFEYGSTHFFVLAELAKRKAGADPLALLEERVFGPIGMRTTHWIRDPSGTPMLAYGAWTTANEWAKYGVLVRDDGVFNGERVLPEGALRGCLEGSAANPAYGRTFWLNQPVPPGVDLGGIQNVSRDGRALWPDGPADLVAAAGARDQRLYIIPSRDLVIVHLSDGDRTFRDPELLALLLEP